MNSVVFPFDKPLTSRQRKDFVEYFSLECMKYCFGDTYKYCFVDDKPDIQDKNKDIGIEVTEAISVEEAQIEGEFVDYRIKDVQKEKDRSKAIIEANGGRLDGFILSYPIKNADIEKKLFQETLRKKMEKLVTYRKKGFKKLGLIIYYEEPPIPFHESDIKLWFDDVMNHYDEKYDNLYFLCPCCIINYDINAGYIESIIIGREKYDILQYRARVAVERIINARLCNKN